MNNALDINMRMQLRRVKKARRVIRNPKWLYPAGVELTYAAYLSKLFKAWEKHVSTFIVHEVESFVKQAGIRKDGWVDGVGEMTQRISFAAEPLKVSAKTAAMVAAKKTEGWNTAQWSKIKRASLGIDLYATEPWLVDVMAAFAQQNVALITNLTESTALQIESLVLQGVTQGKTSAAIARSILQGTDLEPGVFKKVQTRARLIARDQVGKLNGNLTRFRQTAIGVDEYFWRTMRDVRVRPEHVRHDGKKFSWEKPPIGGAPGEAVNCRCYADPDFSKIFDDLPTEVWSN
jgi:SPP1 gp7 family putative phage head morphogenesis protein